MSNIKSTKAGLVEKSSGKKIVSPLDFKVWKQGKLDTFEQILKEARSLNTIITESGEIIYSQTQIDERVAEIDKLIVIFNQYEPC